jgi:Family of unknown function (DUF6174)
MRPPFLGVGLLSSALLALAACDLTGNQDAEERARLAQARSRWQGAAISDYSYELRTLCFCPPEVVGPFAITVSRGTVSSVVFLPTGATVTPVPERHPDVEGLFDIVEKTLDRDPDRLAIEYDSALGYPRRIEVDSAARAADDEITYEATSFLRLN